MVVPIRRGDRVRLTFRDGTVVSGRVVLDAHGDLCVRVPTPRPVYLLIHGPDRWARLEFPSPTT